MRPSGAVAVVVPSGWQVIFQPQHVNDNDVVISAENRQIPQGGGAAFGPGDQMVHLADRGGLLAAAPGAALIDEPR